MRILALKHTFAREYDSPGVDACRLAVRIPIVGVMRASLHFSASLCDRFACLIRERA